MPPSEIDPPAGSPLSLIGLGQVFTRYDAIFSDVWGVVHDGRRASAPACEALARFKRERGPVVLISNSPRPCAEVVDQLKGFGVPDAAWSALVTSGDATRAELIARAPGPAFAIGADHQSPLYSGTGVTLAETPAHAAFISCTGLRDDETQTPEDYRDELARFAQAGLTMVCANPDRVVQRGDRLVYCAGALAELYAALGGQVVMVGKPYPPIYALAFQAADREAHATSPAGAPIARDRILAIGDGVATDVKGANREGLALLFVAGGIHARETLTAQSALDPAGLAALLAREGATADYAMAELHW